MSHISAGTNEQITIRELDSSWDIAWDMLAGNCAEAGFMQSTGWARFKELEGYQTRRVGLFEGDDLWGGAQLMRYVSDHRAGVVYCPEGPVLPWNDVARARAGLKLIQAYARDVAGESGDIGFRIEPHLPSPAPSILRNWVRGPVDLTPLHTVYVDLTQPEADLLARMTPKGRYNLGLSRRHGVMVRRCTDIQDVRAFYHLFRETAARNEFFDEPYGFFLNLASSLFTTGNASVYLAEYEGEVLASIIVVFFGRRATYLYGGSSSRHRRVMPNYALHWAAMRDARAAGCVEYDLYGYDPFGSPSHQYAGISRFKKQWGGERKDWIGSRDLIFYDHLADRIIDEMRTNEAGI